jgi:hypothetical protein
MTNPAEAIPAILGLPTAAALILYLILTRKRATR